MSEEMMFAVLKMPLDLINASPFSVRQYCSRVKEFARFATEEINLNEYYRLEFDFLSIFADRPPEVVTSSIYFKVKVLVRMIEIHDEIKEEMIRLEAIGKNQASIGTIKTTRSEWHIDDDVVGRMVAFLSPSNGGHSPAIISVGWVGTEDEKKYGLRLFNGDYPEEGCILLAEMEPPV